MFKEYLKKQTDSVLWKLLADIAQTMQQRNYGGMESTLDNADNFWLSLATDIKNELDRRLIDGYEPDDKEDI